jgi:hypothetical protein
MNVMLFEHFSSLSEQMVLHPDTEQNLPFQVGNRAIVGYNHTRRQRQCLPGGEYMRRMIMQRMQLCLLLLILGISTSALANPNDYPEFAQQKVDDDISVTFVTAEEVKQRLDAGTPQMLVDVRKSDSFKRRHLPNAVSIPLRSLPERYAEIPRDISVVLY